MRGWTLSVVLLLVAGCTSPDDRPTPGTPDESGQSPGPSDDPGTTTGPPITTIPDRPTTRWEPGDWRSGTCTTGLTQDPGHRSDVWLHAGGRVHRMQWNGTGYHLGASGPEGTRHLAVVGAHAFTSNGSHLMELDEGLEVVASTPARVTAMTAHDGELWLADDWNLSSYHPGLQRIGHAPITLPEHASTTKALDHIAIHGKRAYVIDDVMMPFYAMIVDLEDAADPEHIHTVRWDASGSPAWQWVTADEWWIQGNFFGMGGGGDWANLMPTDGQEQMPLGRVDIAGTSWPVEDPGVPRRSTGYSILATRATQPLLAVISGNGSQMFATLHPSLDHIEYSCAGSIETPLAAGRGMRTTIISDDQGMSAVVVGDWLALFAHGGGRHVLVHEQRLPWIATGIAWSG